jgi:hypothetical protein
LKVTNFIFHSDFILPIECGLAISFVTNFISTPQLGALAPVSRPGTLYPARYQAGDIGRPTLGIPAGEVRYL